MVAMAMANKEGQKPFVILEFEDGVSVVLTKWMSQGNTMCFYPPYTDQMKINKAIFSKQDSTDCWPMYEIKRIFGYADTYERSLEKLRLAEELSDVDSDANMSKKRRIKRARIIESDESNEDVEMSNITLPPLPKLAQQPSQFALKHSSIQRNITSLPKRQTIVSKSLNTPSSSTRSSVVESDLNDDDLILNDDTLTEQHHTTSDRFSSHSETGRDSSHHNVDLEFKKLILKKINYIYRKVDDIDTKLTLAMERQSGMPEGDPEVIEEVRHLLPLKTEEALAAIENRLNEDTGFLKTVLNFLKRKGGKDIHQITTNTMRALISNALGRGYSVCGKKKKTVFKDLTLCRLVIDVVRSQKSEATESEILKLIGIWLSQSTLRYNREQMKNA